MKRAYFTVTFLLLSLTPYASTQDFDVILSGGRIVDGTGNPWFIGDLGLRGDIISGLGRLDRRSSKRVINISGLTIAPGFIDAHSHARRGILEVPGAENYVRQGVTTVLEGQDGGSPLPLRPFLDKLEAAEFAINFATLVGQGSIRRAVLGLENRNAQPEEIQKMKELARQAMLDGAFGMSTGLFYVPGAYTPTEEVIELAKVVGELGGIHISHMRDEAAGVLDSVRETIRIGEEGRLPTQITHHKIIGKLTWGMSKETLELVAAARARGVDVTIDQYPYTASSTGTRALFPQWSQAGGNEALVERLSTTDTRARIKAEIVERILYDRGGGHPKNVVLVGCSFDESLAGKSLAEVTSDRGREVTAENAAETAIELQLEGGCSAIYHAIAETDVERIMQSRFAMVASDGGIPVFGKDVPHPRNYGTFARVLGRYVREKKLLPLEEAVRKMTSLPASRLGLANRGVLRPGMKADITVFDHSRITDRAEFLEPHQYAEGVHHVFVSGRAVLLDGKMTGELPGQVLYGPARKAE